MDIIVKKPPGDIRRERVRFPYFVLAVSMLLTVGVTLLFYQSAKSKDINRFNNSLVRVRSAIENRIGLYTALLKAARGFIESSNVINREEFAGFVRSLELESKYSGLQGIGYSMVVRPEEREALAAKMRSEGHPDFHFSPAPQTDLNQAIIYFEPLSENDLGLIGYDMSNERLRREAIERAIDTGMASATGKITLFQFSDAGPQEGFLVFVPVYRNGRVPATKEERRQNIEGFVFGRFNADNLLNDVQNTLGSNSLAIKVFDGEAAAENLLTETGDTDRRNFSIQIDDRYSAQNEIEVAGQKWLIEYRTLPSFATQSSVNWTPLIFLCGVLFSFLLFGMTYWEAATRAKLQLIAGELTESEREKHALFEDEQKARQLAEQANKTKDEFISVVSHELRTPLNAIAGWTRILRNDELSSETKHLALEKIEKNLRLQTSLVEDLLNFSQILSARGSLENRAVNFSAAFDEVFFECEPSARKKRLDFTRKGSLNGQEILGDEEKIKMVIRNLLSNAIKFTPAGGRVEAEVRQTAGEVEMIVRDSGKGIKKDFLPHIFERFRQDESSTTRKYGGLGLGLAISRHIVRLHHGSIEADSDGEGRGSVFRVRFPVLNN